MTNSVQQQTGDKQRYLIVGLGQSGLSVAEYFAHYNINFDVQDDRETPPKIEAFTQLGVAAKLLQQALTTELMNGYDSIVVSPGISVQSKVLPCSIKVKQK